MITLPTLNMPDVRKALSTLFSSVVEVIPGSTDVLRLKNGLYAQVDSLDFIQLLEKEIQKDDSHYQEYCIVLGVLCGTATKAISADATTRLTAIMTIYGIIPSPLISA